MLEKVAWVNFLTHVICSTRDYSDWILLKQNIWWSIRNAALIKIGLELNAKWQGDNNQQVRSSCFFHCSDWGTFQSERFSFCASQREAMAVPCTSQLLPRSCWRSLTFIVSYSFHTPLSSLNICVLSFLGRCSGQNWSGHTQLAACHLCESWKSGHNFGLDSEPEHIYATRTVHLC